MSRELSSNVEIVRLAIAGIDAQIKGLQEKRAEYAKMISGRVAPPVTGPSIGSANEAESERKRRTMSAATRKKIAAAAKARWAKIKAVKAGRKKA
jgi:hypothetical protein